MTNNNLIELLQLERQKSKSLEQQLADVHQELHNTNSELLQLTLDLDGRVAKRTRKLQESEQALRQHRDHLQEMVDDRTQSLKRINETLEEQVEARTAELTIKYNELHLEIAKRIRAERESSESKKSWQEIFEAIGQMTIIIDPQYNIVAANRSTLKTLDLTIDQVVGGKCHTVFQNFKSPDHCPANCPLKRAMANSTRDSCEDEIEINGKSYLVSCTPVYNEENQLHKIIHIATDITKIKQLEIDLVQAQKLESLGTLAGGIAHDFNNILSIIFGFNSLSLDHKNIDQELIDNLTEVQKAAMRARDLVNQILTFARKTDEQVQSIEVNLIAKEILKMLRSTTPSTIKIIDNLQGNSKVLANPTQIHQIFLNLATNSIQAMSHRDTGLLSISTRSEYIGVERTAHYPNLAPGNYVKIQVGDNGSGISRRNIDLIFEPYFTTKGVGEGTGLGLAVIHGIVKSCGGKVFVDSTPGRGTTFSVFLPVLDEKTDQIKKEELEPAGGGEYIYIIDDEPPIVEILTRTLTSLGYNVRGETDSLKALDEIKRTPDAFDMVISDMTMPNLSGENLAKEILKIRPDLPIIICSGYSSKLSKEKAIQIGVKELLVKPINKTAFAQTIRKILDEKIAIEYSSTALEG